MDYIIKMPPVPRRKVRVRAKYLGPAKPKIIYEPIPDETEEKKDN